MIIGKEIKRPCSKKEGIRTGDQSNDDGKEYTVTETEGKEQGETE